MEGRTGRTRGGDWTTWWAARPAPEAERWQDFTCLLVWLLGLQLLDLLTTLGALAHGAGEGNPLAAVLLRTSGPAGLVRLKVAAVVLMLGWLPAFASVRRSAAALGVLALLALLAVGYSGVVVHNLAVLGGQMP